MLVENMVGNRSESWFLISHRISVQALLQYHARWISRPCNKSRLFSPLIITLDASSDLNFLANAACKYGRSDEAAVTAARSRKGLSLEIYSRVQSTGTITKGKYAWHLRYSVSRCCITASDRLSGSKQVAPASCCEDLLGKGCGGALP